MNGESKSMRRNMYYIVKLRNVRIRALRRQTTLNELRIKYYRKMCFTCRHHTGKERIRKRIINGTHKFTLKVGGLVD
jgi:hypothetical protein